MGAAAGERRQHRDEADRPRADDDRDVAGRRLGLGDGVNADGQGSTIAAAANDTLSGSLKVKASGCTTLGRNTPCTGGVAQNWTAGSRL